MLASRFRSKMVRRTPFLSQLHMNTIVLPRQARDKHRATSRKSRCLQARGELEARKAQKQARLEQERRRALRNQAQTQGATKIGAVFKGMMQRRMYTFLKGQERARIGAAGISNALFSSY